jgi:hypothetical protein
MPVLMKELWAPSLDIAAFGISYILTCFENEVRNKSLSSSVKPYGIKAARLCSGMVANLSSYEYDHRLDS